MRLEEVEQQLDAAKKKQTDLKTRLAASTAKLAKMKADYEGAVKSAEAEAMLDAMHAEIKAAEIKVERARTRLDQVDDEIQQLAAEQQAAFRVVEHQKYLDDVKAGRVEARALEAKTQEVVQLAEVHNERLRRMNDYCRSVGVQQVGYKLSNLSERITAIFRRTGPYKHEPYDQIFEGNIDKVEKQLKNNGAPANHEAPSVPTTNGEATERTIQ